MDNKIGILEKKCHTFCRQIAFTLIGLRRLAGEWGSGKWQNTMRSEYSILDLILILEKTIYCDQQFLLRLFPPPTPAHIYFF